jgi:hypothetical protein
MLLTSDIHLGGVTECARPFAEFKDVLQNADIVCGNLEGALWDEIDSYVSFSKTNDPQSPWESVTTILAGI